MNAPNPPELTNVPQRWSRDAIQAAAGYAGRHDRLNTRSYYGAVAASPVRVRISDEPRPSPISRLACHYGIHRWVTMTTGRAGFVHFQRCERRCGSSRIRKGVA